jgi:hypothetical protein
MMYQAIDRGDHHSLIRKNFIPFGKWLISGDQQRAVLVASADEFEQSAGLGVVLVDVRDVVANQQMVFIELGDGCFKLQCLARLLETLNKVSGPRKQHTITVFDESAPDRHGQMRLAHTWKTRVILPGIKPAK